MPKQINRMPEPLNEDAEIPADFADAEISTRGLSLVHERLSDPGRINTEGNPVFYKIEGQGQHVVVGRSESGVHQIGKGDAIDRSKSGSYYVYPDGAIDRVNNPDSDTHLVIPIKVPAANATVQPPKS